MLDPGPYFNSGATTSADSAVLRQFGIFLTYIEIRFARLCRKQVGGLFKRGSEK